MMRSRLPALLLLSWCGGLLAGVVGCSRSAVVAPAEAVPARAEAPPVVRAKAPAEDPEPVREKPAVKPEGFRFPDDPGGALLAKVLSPGEAAPSPVDRTSGPRRLPPPDLEPLTLPLPGSRAPLVPRLPVQHKSPSLPPFLEDSLGGPRRDPALPSGPMLPAGERTRIPSVDVNQPIPLPILAQPVTDRVPLDDATGEASTAAALSAPIPRRTTPAPFLRLTLPDPYEHRRPLDVEPPAEQSDPTAARPQTPKR